MNPTYHRTNLNLFTEDVAYMQHAYGRGWTEQARDIIHQEIKEIKKRTYQLTPSFQQDKDGNTTFRGIPIRFINDDK